MKIEIQGKLIKKLKGLEEFSNLHKDELSEALTELVEELLETHIECFTEDDDDKLFSESDSQGDDDE